MSTPQAHPKTPNSLTLKEINLKNKWTTSFTQSGTIKGVIETMAARDHLAAIRI